MSLLSDFVGNLTSKWRGTELFNGGKPLDKEVPLPKSQNISLYPGFDATEFRKHIADVDISLIPKNTKTKHKTIYVAQTDTGVTNINVQVYYSLMTEYFDLYGINQVYQLDRYVSLRDLCMMPKTPGHAVAIPPPEYWPFMAMTCLYVLGPLVKEFGSNVIVRGGYRPEDYNKAVGGAPDSRHIYFQAVDLDCGTFKGLMDMIKFTAKIFNSPEGRKCRMGFGVYGTVARPTHFHVDTCYLHRHWGRAHAFI